VVYDPGVLKVVALDEAGNALGEHEVRTAGAPASIELIPDRGVIAADGKDLSFITVRMLDGKGTLCPTADHELEIQVSGEGELAAADNGSAVSDRSFQSNRCPLYNGLAMIMVRSREGDPGEVTAEVSAAGLPATSITIQTRGKAGR
jgi:beta-galactosidase